MGCNSAPILVDIETWLNRRVSPCLLTLTIDSFAAMLNCEFSDHPDYDALELQWFDDERHGRGMLAFLSRRSDGRVDYYLQPGLRLDRDAYAIGGGVGAWVETEFETARLIVADDGVFAEAHFVDVDGRAIEVRIDDRDGQQRERAGLLAPISAGIQHPNSLMLVWLPSFDLLRATSNKPVIRIGGADARVGRLPGERLHRRILVKYAAPIVVATVAEAYDGPIAGLETSHQLVSGAAGSVGAVVAAADGHIARLCFVPEIPDPEAMSVDSSATGRWQIAIDGTGITGGSWAIHRTHDRLELGVDVTERWRPGPLPLLMRLVTTMVPVFRRWPTSYRWRATAQLGADPTLTSRWERTGSGGRYLNQDTSR